MAERKVMNCRSCGKLMGQAESCPYCGRARNSPLGYVTSLLGSASGPNGLSLTKMIMGFCILVFAGVLLLSLYWGGPSAVMGAVLSPSSTVLLVFGLNTPNVFLGAWWTVITSVFLHIGVIHLLFNMYALSIVGPIMEMSIGRSAFWLLFVLSGAFGAFLSAYHGYNAAGASGAIMGLVGAGISISFLAGRRMDDPLLRTFVTWAGITFAFGLFSGLNIDNWGHFGGFAAGLVFGGLWHSGRRSEAMRRTLTTLSSVLAVVVILAYLFHIYFVTTGKTIALF